VVTVEKAVVYRHGDVQQPAAIAFDVAAPVDSRDGILGVSMPGLPIIVASSMGTHEK
jgi:hypothetical protein